MARKLVFINLIGKDFTKTPFDINKTMSRVKIQNTFGVPRAELVSNDLEYSIVKYSKLEFKRLKRDLSNVLRRPRLKNKVVDKANADFKLSNGGKFSNVDKALSKQLEKVKSINVAILLFDNNEVQVYFYSKRNYRPVLYNIQSISEVKIAMRHYKLKEIFN